MRTDNCRIVWQCVECVSLCLVSLSAFLKAIITLLFSAVLLAHPSAVIALREEFNLEFYLEFIYGSELMSA